MNTGFIRLKAIRWVLAAMTATLLQHNAVQAEDVIADNVTIQATGSNTAAFVDFQQVAGAKPAYLWELAGFQESTFWVNDKTSSRLGLVFNGSPISTLAIGSTGNFGIDTPNPVVAFHLNHVAEAKAETLARFTGNNTTDRLDFNNGSATAGVYIPRIQGVTFSANAGLILESLTADGGGSPAIAHNVATVAGVALVNRPLVVYRNNNVQQVFIAANGDMFATSFSPISSRAFKERIADLDLPVATAALGEMTPVEFVYKDDATKRQRIGFIAEDVPEIIANSDRQSVPLMDAVALVTRVAKGHQSDLDTRSQTLGDQATQLDDHEKALSKQQDVIDETRKALNAQQKKAEEQTDELNRLRQRLEAIESRVPGH